MAVKGGSGPRLAAYTAKRAKRCILNCLETSSKPYQTLLSELLETSSKPDALTAVPLESTDPVAGLKHHGSEGRIKPAAGSP